MKPIRFSITVMLALMLSLGATDIAAETETKTRVVGTWTLQVEMDDESSETTLEIQNGDDGLTGTWTGPRGSHELEDVSWDGEELSFAWKVGRNSIQGTATVEEDDIRGTLTTPRGKGSFTGRRSDS